MSATERIYSATEGQRHVVTGVEEGGTRSVKKMR
jgi:hypothetical protein